MKTLNNRIKIAIPCAVSLLLFTACGTKQKIAEMKPAETKVEKVVTAPKKTILSNTYLHKVRANEVNENSVVGSISFSAQADGRTVNCPGSLKMYKDKMIRMQLFIPLLGTEVGRLEFTPTYVLVVDRLHKEYIKAEYNEVDFLRNNGLNFYSLQSLFWNKLFKPAVNQMTNADLDDFVVGSGANATQNTVSLQTEKLSYVWKTETANGKIKELEVKYKGGSAGKAGLVWTYGNFIPVGTKSFPASQSFTLQMLVASKAKKATISFELEGIKTNKEAEEETTLSTKYKKIEPKEIFNKIIPN